MAVSIPLSSTTITIKRAPADLDGTDPYDPPSIDVDDLDTVETGVRALFASPSGTELGPAGSQESVDWKLLADPCDLQHADTVVDDTTGRLYGVVWAKPRPDEDLAHVVAGVNEVEGAA